MLKKARKTSVGGLLRGFLVVELACVGGAYYVYHRMNTDREYRQYISEKFPSILNGFYYVGEKLGNLQTRQEDKDYWDSMNNKKT